VTERTVLFCNQAATARGGVETWLAETCAELVRHRWRPIVALVRGSSVHRPELFRAAHPDLETVEIDGRGLPRDSRVRAVVRCLRRVRPAAFVPLIVADAHDAACVVKAGGQPVRYVLAMHQNYPAQVADVCRQADFVDLAAHPGVLTGHVLEWAGVPLERIRRIPLGLRPARRARTPRLPGAPIRLGYVGRMTQLDKRVGDLVPFCGELLRAGVRFQVDLVGDGPERAGLEHALSAFPAPIRFHGALAPGEIYDRIYPELDALLLFSESEAFGMVLAEALAHQVVPVSSRYLGYRSEGLVVDGTTALLFDVGDAASAATAVRRLDSEPGLADRLRSHGRERAAALPTWGETGASWAAALDETVARPARVGSLRPRPREGHGRLDRLRIPPALVDVARRWRRRLFGVPPEVRGEEWPWTRWDHDRGTLESIEAVMRVLDRAPHERRLPPATLSPRQGGC
jgi:glycosyltransferase involved in cell wall biosynthesis